MKTTSYYLLLCMIVLSLSSCGGRNIRSASDITPNHPNTGEVLDWRYGANDLKIQTTEILKKLIDRWYEKTQYNNQNGKPSIIITGVDNQTDTYIPTTMIRDVIEGIAINDGRFVIVAGDQGDDQELDSIMNKIQNDTKYQNESKLEGQNAKAPQFLSKIRLTKAITYHKYYDIEDYRMTITLYNIETREAVDSAWDVLRKKVKL